MSALEKLNAIASQRILILDGAMGSMIQSMKLGEEDFRGRRFADHAVQLSGCIDLLCLTRPEAISGIHRAYLEAGADIIETCSFNANAVSLADYGLADLAYEISYEAARIAKKAANEFCTDGKPRFVAGSMGPTGKSASLSPDVSDPGKRGIYWDELEAAFYDNARGLLDGGADILLIETAFDTLNIKAALSAISRQKGARHVPVMVSATVSGNSGRLLAGQTIEAFCASILHAAPSADGMPWSIGLNCSFGAEKLLPHMRRISAAVNGPAANRTCLVSAHPNAGLPNQLGTYDESPQTMAAHIEQYLQEGLVNIIGGCCGSTPAHIRAIAEKAALYRGRGDRGSGIGVQGCEGRGSALGVLRLAGLELLEVSHKKNNTPGGKLHLTLIGERTNVSGSRKFLRLISEGKYQETLTFARQTIEDGAAILNVGMDDAMLDAEKSMRAFLDLALSDPEIARVPVMLDSSRWNVIEAGLKRLQGKALVNSINLKDGEDEFLRRASMIRRYGAAAVVMLIDEKGQAVSYERKIEIAGRAWQLLADAGFPPEDIVFDPNVLAVATGIGEHDSCAVDFIRACAWIRENCPEAQISGGISNLSYSFRGNNAVREAMHSVFLHHAQAAGLSMAIVNPAGLIAYNAIEKNFRDAVEDVILNRKPNATDHLLKIAETEQVKAASHSPLSIPRSPIPDPHSPFERIMHAMIHGLDDSIEKDVLEFRENENKTPLEIIEGPLMDGMKEVGKRFDEGTMYLPQVIRSARVMKKAAAVLEPFMEKNNGKNNSPKIILATVKGDVHDIGKNIVAVVLACNGYEVIDLGVMVPAEQIIETALKENAAIIGLSGLISPSLDEMANTAREMEKQGMKIPLLIGGAAASLIHTALRLAPAYSGPAVYVPNAGKSAETVRALLSEKQRPQFLLNLEQGYREAVQRHEAIHSRIELLPLEAARASKVPPADYIPVAPKVNGIIELNNYPLEKVIPRIDWDAFLNHWDLSREEKISENSLLSDAQVMLERIKAEGLLELRGVTGVFPAASENEDILIGARHRFCFSRNRQQKPEEKYNPCLADFILPAKDGQTQDWLGLFALSAGLGISNGGFDAAAWQFRHNNDDYSALLLSSLANALAEAFAEEIHCRISEEWWGYKEKGSGIGDRGLGIRPAFGYPSCPNHEDKRIAFELLEAEKRCGMKLTESAMIVPAASVCGMIFASPATFYFGVGEIL